MQSSYIEFNIIANLNFPVSKADSMFQMYEEQSSDIKICWINFKSPQLLDAIEEEKNGIKIELILEKHFLKMDSSIKISNASMNGLETIKSFLILITNRLGDPIISNLINSESITNFFSELSILASSNIKLLNNHQIHTNTGENPNKVY